ncbi:hypothetical protein MKX73_19100 [Solibacillus sp. FSL W7-1436]|uniref:hypothetical protein n=1 Tax=Solibacillus sp. FSL W7-1436 TaxID=2921705 RepID=UPI0030FA6758
MNKASKDSAHLIIDKIVLEPLKEEMTIIQKSLNSISEKYSFLMKGDIDETKELIIKTFLLADQSQNEDESISFDEQAFYTAISDETKQQIVDEAFSKFISKMTVNELKMEGD